MASAALTNWSFCAVQSACTSPASVVMLGAGFCPCAAPVRAHPHTSSDTAAMTDTLFMKPPGHLGYGPVPHVVRRTDGGRLLTPGGNTVTHGGPFTVRCRPEPSHRIGEL